MGIDELITLEDGKEYILLLKTNFEDKNYFLATLLIDNEPSDTYTILREYIEDGQISVEEVKDQELIDKITVDFDRQVDIGLND